MKKIIVLVVAWSIPVTIAFFCAREVGYFGLKTEYEKQKRYNAETGNIDYRVKVYHWRNFKIIRSKTYYEIPADSLPSVYKTEDSIANIIKSKL